MISRKIIHVLSGFPSKSETFIINHIVECIDYGFESVILTNSLKSIEESSQKEILKKYKLFDTAKITRVEIPKNKFFRIIKAFFLLIMNLNKAKVFFRILNLSKGNGINKTIKLWFQAARFLEFKSDDLFHAHFGINGVLLAEMKELGAIQGEVIVSFYGYDTFSTIENRIELKKIYSNLYKFSKIILVSSVYLKSNLLLLDAPESKIKLNHVGVDLTLFPYNKREQKKVFNIITVGRLIHLKGQHIGIDVVDKLSKKNYDIHYHIVGDGAEKENLKRLISSKSLDEYITMHGSLSQKEIIQLLNESELFLMTSITDADGRCEGQGLVIAEAQSTGLPIIAFDSGGVKETILDERTGFLVEEKNIEDVVEKVEQLISSFALRESFGINGREYIEKEFSSKKQSLKIIKIYQELLESKN